MKIINNNNHLNIIEIILGISLFANNPFDKLSNKS